MAAEVLPLEPIKLPTGPAALTPEQKYWRTFTNQLLLPSPHSSPITSITVPSASPNASTLAGTPPAETFAVTSGTRIQIYGTRTRKLLKTITRFNIDDTAHSGHIRRDGRILVAGGESGAIQAFDANSRAILKTWREHRQPVWTTRWHPSELTSLMSCSDDRTVRLWDLPSEDSVATFHGHQDYVRSGCFMPGQASRLLVSGSYDQTVRLWDPRATNGRSVMVFKHAAAVESVLPLPSGTTLLASADNAISVLDLVAGKPMQVLRNHQKTVTALSLASNGTRIVSGALDGHVKVFETTGWNVVAGFKYPSPVLSLSVVPSGVNMEDKHLAVGLQSGLLSIRTRLSGQQKAQARERAKEMKALLEGKIEEYDRKQTKKRGRGWEKRMRGKDYTGEGADIIIDGNDRGKIKHLSQWEAALRKGQYEKALDVVLDKGSPQDIITLLTAMRHRNALRTALERRDEITLQPILKWVNKKLKDPRHIGLTTDISLLILDIYAEQMGQSPEIDALVGRMHESVRKNAEISQQAFQTKGMLDMLIAGG